MSKSPAFQWYAADYLADERVMMLSLESEAAYVRLLSLCWREGSIPAKPELCAPLCKYADVKIIKPALALFMKAPGQPGRLIHKRLEEERDKQEAFRAKQAAHGKKGGRPRKDDEKPEKPNPLSSLSQPLPDPLASLSPRMPSSLSSTSSSTSSNDDERETSASALKLEVGGKPLNADHPTAPTSVAVADPAKAAALATTDYDEEQSWQESPLVKPAPFRIICDRVPLYVGIAYEHYRHLMLAAVEGTDTRRTVKQWQSWIHKFLTNQTPKGGRLLTGIEVADQAKTGVHAPQHPDAPNHKPRPEVQARKDAEFEAQKQLKIAANLARNAADGLSQQAQPGGVARTF